MSSDAPDPTATGTGRPAPTKDPEKPRAERAGPGRTEIGLEVSRQRSIGWTIFGIGLGSLLIWKFGTVSVWGGVALLAMGIYHAWQLFQTFRYPPGSIIVTDHEVSLPRGLCVPHPVVAIPQDVTAVYLLRRSVPWNRAAPVLIVELGPKAMAFPRDWFASEADQRHVIHALLREKSAATGGAAPTVSS